ncbi:MAG: AMP-binding protein [Deltaproteobacteria bacterium]|nr:AMP-binding protein [Deltaproteobacteria bacterium]
MEENTSSRPEQGRFFNKEAETMDWGRRRERLAKRFVAAFRQTMKNSRAYMDIYGQAGLGPDEVRGLEDLAKLPIVRMDDLVARQRQDPPWGGFATVEPERIRRVYVNPGLIFQPGDWDYQDTSWAEGLCGAGFRPGDRVLNTFNYHLWPFAFMLDESLKMIGATVVPTGPGNTFMQVRILRRLKINAFAGTPSFLMELAQRAEGRGLDLKEDLFLERALVGAEMLPESLRKRLQDKLQATVRQIYGTVFLGCLGYECQEADGLHVPDSVLVEVVDPETGKPVAPGATGEIVATNFSQTYPLIRLATGDLSTFHQGSCPCGRTGPRLKKVLGRIDQATKVRGTFVHPWQTDEVVARHPEVFRYQVVVTREDHADLMTFWVELIEEISDPSLLKGRIEMDIKDLLTIRGEVKIVPRGTIPDFQNKIDDRRTWG